MARQDKAQAAEKLAAALRSAVETAQGKVQLGHVLEWKDYARGKDLARCLRDKPELAADLVRPAGPDRTADDVAADAVVQLVQRRLLVPCDRRFTKPKPGRTKLVKWPRTLDPVADPAALTALQPSLFYAWRADRPAGAWYYALSAAAVAGVLLLTLFPLAPQWARVAVLYALLGLLSTLLGAVALRYVVFVAVWVATGWHLWLLPNLMSDTVPITEVLSPPVSFERGAGPATARHYGARAATLAAVVGAAFALARTAPDARSVRKGVSDAHFTLLEYFDLHSARDALGGNNGTGAANATAGAGGRKAGAPAGQPRWQQQHQQQQQRAHQQQQQRAQQQASRAAQKEREEDDGEEEVIDLGAAGGAGSEQQQQGRQQQRASSSKAEGGERGGDEL